MPFAVLGGASGADSGAAAELKSLSFLIFRIEKQGFPALSRLADDYSQRGSVAEKSLTET